MSNDARLIKAVPPDPSLDFVYEAGLKKIDDQLRLIESLDTKMSVLIGFVGALVAGLLAALLASDTAKLQMLVGTPPTEIILGASALLLALDLCFAFQAFRMRKLYSGVVFQDLVAWVNEDVPDTKRAFISTLIETVTFNERVLKVKQRNVIRAVWLTFLTLLALLAAVIVAVVRALTLSGG